MTEQKLLDQISNIASLAHSVDAELFNAGGSADTIAKVQGILAICNLTLQDSNQDSDV